MTHRLSRGLCIATLATVLMVGAACSNPQDSPSETAPVPETAAVPETPDPSPDADASRQADTVVVRRVGEPLELVAIGDSFIGWSTVAEKYASSLEGDLDTDVNVSKITNPTTNRLAFLRTDDSSRALLASADIVVVEPQPGPPSSPVFDLYLAGECGGADNQACLHSAREDFGLYVGELFDELVTMTPRHTAILATLVGAWGVSAFYPDLEQTDPEAYRLFVDHVVALQDLSAAAAATRGIAAVDVTLEFHGPDAYQPVQDGYLLPDGAHLTNEGSQVVAALLYDVTLVER